MTDRLETKALRFQELVEDVFRDAQGLIRGSLHQATRRVWRAEYFDATRDVLRAPGLPQPEVWWAYEQTNITQGFYLLSLVYQHRVTGAAQTLKLAQRTFDAIRRVYQLAPETEGETRSRERGFLPKPYGGRLSQETHPDQYFPVALGLAAYSELASPQERSMIGEMLTRCADFWIRSQYRLVYFGVPISINGRTRLNLLPLFGLAYKFSADNHYRDELLKQLAGIAPLLPLFDGANPPDRVRSPFGRYFGWFLAVGYLLQEGYLARESGEKLLYDYWRAAKATIADDGMCYADVTYDLKEDRFYLPQTGYSQVPLFEDRILWDFVYWVGHLKSAFGTAGLAAAAVMVQQYLPQLEAIREARRALTRVREEDLASYIDDEGGQLDPRHTWLTEDFRSDAAALWLLAYWSGRDQGFWE